MNRNYDTIAGVYDRLAGLVYGKALISARAFLVSTIAPGSTILIVGGGTGWELEAISELHPSGIRITYIDASAKMIALAEKKNTRSNEVQFINGLFETTVLTGMYDVIITPFFLDNFSDVILPPVFMKLHELLLPNGKWLYCDFRNTKIFWQKTVLKIMYIFFRLFCGIGASKLPDFEALFVHQNYHIVRQQLFFHDFINAIVYEKTA